MRTPITQPIADLLPHAGAMRWLDRAIEADEESLLAETRIGPTHLLNDGAGVGAWAGIELMAQAVAAWAGWRARQRGEAPRIGFLLGTRRYRCQRPRFAIGERLQIEVRCEFLADNGLGKFDGQIRSNGELLASAALTVFEPVDALAYLRGEHD